MMTINTTHLKDVIFSLQGEGASADGEGQFREGGDLLAVNDVLEENKLYEKPDAQEYRS